MAPIRIVLLLTAALSASAATVHEYDTCIPLVREGAGWKTIVTLVNLGDMPSSWNLNFLGEKGLRELWPIKISVAGASASGQSVNGVLAPGATVDIETSGGPEQGTRGYAHLSIFSGPRLGASARLVHTADGKIGTVISVPLSPETEQRAKIPVSFTEQDSTELILVSETNSTVVDLVFRDSAGREVFTDSLTFGDSAQLVLPLVTRYPDLKGLRGTLSWAVSFPGADIYEDLTFSVLALSKQGNGMAAVSAMTLPENQGRRSQH